MEDLAAIGDYIAAFSPGAAIRFQSGLVRAGDNLAAFSERGRPAPPGVRELTIVRPYLIRYVVVGDEVWILSIRHSARKPEV